MLLREQTICKANSVDSFWIALRREHHKGRGIFYSFIWPQFSKHLHILTALVRMKVEDVSRFEPVVIKKQPKIDEGPVYMEVGDPK